MSKPLRRTAATTVLAVGALLTAGLAPAAAAPAPEAAGADAGLYGANDPTYDGVYRQSLAIAGLAAVQSRVPRKAVRWLLDQQCSNGSFQPYRADTAVACDKGDPVNYTGQDTNQTAAAAMALRAVGYDSEAREAIAWLRRSQSKDGGFPYYKGGASDANSTGLAMSAIRSDKATKSNTRALQQGAAYLRTVQLRCSAKPAQRGLVSYQSDPKTANDFSSVQAAVGLLTTLPVVPADVADDGGPLRCQSGKAKGKADLTTSLLAALKKRLNTSGGMLPSSLGSGSDPSATAQAVLALTAADVYPQQRSRAVKRLRKAASVYTGTGGDTDPGALGTLLLVAGATGANPGSFGGVDLVTGLGGTLR